MNSIENYRVTDTRETLEVNADQAVFDDLYDRHLDGELTWEQVLVKFQELVVPNIGEAALQNS